MTFLFAPSPRRKCGLILTLGASLLFHGLLICVAAFWPTRPAEGKSKTTILDFDDPLPPGEPELPAAVPPGEPDVAPPLLKVTEAADNPPPPAIEPSLDDMTVSTPAPRAAARPVSASSHPLTPRAQNVPSPGGPAGNIGSGRPGSTARWNTPRPVYPPSLRLAHVQGSGTVRVTTDGSGRVTSATIVRSTGNALLDDNTCRAAKSGWSGPPDSTISVPITYQLQ